MKQTHLGNLMVLAFLLLSCSSYAQELKEMQLADVPEAEQKPVVVLDPNEAILVVYSTIPDLAFESNLGIISMESPDPGIFYLHLQPGTNLITFQAPGYLSLKERVYIDRKQSRQVKLTAKASAAPEGFGEIRITTNPPGANIELDGFQIVEQTPYTNAQFAAGDHRIKLTPDDGYFLVDTLITVAKDQIAGLNVNFVRKTGGLLFNIKPVNAEVYLDGKLLKPVPTGVMNYPTGTCIVEARLPGRPPAKLEVKVRYDQTTRVDLDATQSTYGAPTSATSGLARPPPAERCGPAGEAHLDVFRRSQDGLQHRLSYRSGGSEHFPGSGLLRRGLWHV